MIFHTVVVSQRRLLRNHILVLQCEIVQQNGNVWWKYLRDWGVEF